MMFRFDTIDIVQVFRVYGFNFTGRKAKILHLEMLILTASVPGPMLRK